MFTSNLNATQSNEFHDHVFELGFCDVWVVFSNPLIQVDIKHRLVHLDTHKHAIVRRSYRMHEHILAYGEFCGAYSYSCGIIRILESWLSGRKHHLAKVAEGKPSPGFESLTLRLITYGNHSKSNNLGKHSHSTGGSGTCIC